MRFRNCILLAGLPVTTAAAPQDLVERRAGSNLHFCRACPHSSASRRDLLRHVEARHVAGDYPCGFCGQSFRARHYLMKHVNGVHRAEKEEAAAVAEGGEAGAMLY